jgi:hypothetical protein
MKSPRHLTEYTDRHRDCQFAVEPQVMDLIEQAFEAGWSRKEAILSIASVVVKAMAREKENRRSEASIARAARRH